MKITYLEDSKKFDELIKNKVLVDFYADWCGPCKMLGEVIENSNIDIDCLKVNVDEFRIMSIPTVILFDNNKEVNKNIGFMDEDELEEFINQ